MTEHNHGRTACGPSCPANPWHRKYQELSAPVRPTKAHLVEAVELSAQALREMLAEEPAVDAAVRGAYAPVVEELAGNMYNHGIRLIEQEPRGAHEDLNFTHGWNVGARWMLEKMVGYVTGERL